MKKNAPFFQGLVKNLNNYIDKDPTIQISFDFGARVSVTGYSKKKYRVEFWHTSGTVQEFATEIAAGFYAAPSRKYVTDWDVRVFDGTELIKREKVELKGKTVHIFLESSSLGDSLSWTPQIVKFGEINKCNLVITTFYNDLFEKKYPHIQWNRPGSALPRYDYSYKIGYHYDDDRFSKTPIDPRTVPLGKVPCDILGIPYEEIRPELDFEPWSISPVEKPYVCIATSSTAGAKLWHRPNGWQEVVDHLIEKGYRVAVIQKEPTDLRGVLDWTGDVSLKERMNQLHHAKLFIGLGSGLSWLAWAVKKKVILISGFSDPLAEFTQDCERIINRNVCNSCWNDPLHSFDKGDWNWCPRLKGTERQFECSSQITSQTVKDSIDKLLV